MKATKQRFQIDGIDGEFEGYARDQFWNGFSIPYFEKPEADRLMIALKAADYTTTIFNTKADAYVTNTADQDPNDFDIWSGIDIETEDGPKHAYSIGGMAWCWSWCLTNNDCEAL